jgi:ATP-dependent Clp protease, protease subunit
MDTRWEMELSMSAKLNDRTLAQTVEMIVPEVFERGAYGERSYDIFSRLLKERIIFLGATISDAVSNVIIAQLLFLEHEDSKKDIWLYINSSGGSIMAGLAIYDAMQFVHAPIATVCIGKAASMATILLCGGAKGKRYALPNSTIHQHPAISTEIQGYAPDIEIQARFLLSNNRRLRQIMAKHTGHSIEDIIRDFDRDCYMNPEEAKEYGFIDVVLSSPLVKTY